MNTVLGTPIRRGVTTVVVSVNGSNPNAPQFDYFTYRTIVSELAPVDKVLMRLVARDPDPGLEGQIRYRLASDPVTQVAAEYFQIDPVSGVF